MVSLMARNIFVMPLGATDELATVGILKQSLFVDLIGAFLSNFVEPIK